MEQTYRIGEYSIVEVRKTEAAYSFKLIKGKPLTYDLYQ